MKAYSRKSAQPRSHAPGPFRSSARAFSMILGGGPTSGPTSPAVPARQDRGLAAQGHFRLAYLCNQRYWPGQERGEELAVEDQQQRYERAHARVQAIKGFYIHASVFVLVNIGLFVINLLTGGGWWFY